MEKPSSALQEAEAIIDAEFATLLESPEEVGPVFVAVAEAVKYIEQAEQDGKDEAVVAFEALIHANYTTPVEEAETYLYERFTQHLGLDEPVPAKIAKKDAKNISVTVAEAVVRSAYAHYLLPEQIDNGGFSEEEAADRERLMGNFVD